MEQRSTSWSRPIAFGFGALLVLGYAGASAKLAADHSHFIADDLVAFWFAAYKPFSTYIALRLDIHLAPLHRLTTYAVRMLWPMNFAAALGVLVSFHLATVALLYMTLERLNRSVWNWAFVGLYATHVYLPPLLFWWTAAVHRLPCLMFSVAAIYAYVRFRDSGRWRWVAVLCASELFAFGYFIKAALVPLMLIGIEACLWRTTESGARRRNGIAIAASALVAIVYVSIWFAGASEPARAIAPKVAYLANSEWWSWMVFLVSLLGFWPGGAIRIVAALTVWIGAVALTLWKGRSSAAGWLWLVLVVSVSIFMTLAPLSRYVLLQGSPFETVHRYYFELMLPFVLFLALAFRSTIETARARATSMERVVEAAAALVLVVSAVHSYSTARALVSVPPYTSFVKQKELIDNLRHDLAGLHARGNDVVLVDGELPPFTLGWLGEWRKQSKLLEAMGTPATFGRHGNYRILDDGHVVPVR